MQKTNKAGRNDRCPCGSGKKFKTCCERRQQRSRFSIVMIVLVASAVLGALAYGFTSMDEGSNTPAVGKVWSPEHGHWH